MFYNKYITFNVYWSNFDLGILLPHNFSLRGIFDWKLPEKHLIVIYKRTFFYAKGPEIFICNRMVCMTISYWKYREL